MVPFLPAVKFPQEIICLDITEKGMFSQKHCACLEQRMWLFQSKHNMEMANTTPSEATKYGHKECPYSENRNYTHGARQEAGRHQILPLLFSIVVYRTIGYEKEIKPLQLEKKRESSNYFQVTWLCLLPFHISPLYQALDRDDLTWSLQEPVSSLCWW